MRDELFDFVFSVFSDGIYLFLFISFDVSEGGMGRALRVGWAGRWGVGNGGHGRRVQYARERWFGYFVSVLLVSLHFGSDEGAERRGVRWA